MYLWKKEKKRKIFVTSWLHHECALSLLFLPTIYIGSREVGIMNWKGCFLPHSLHKLGLQSTRTLWLFVSQEGNTRCVCVRAHVCLCVVSVILICLLFMCDAELGPGNNDSTSKQLALRPCDLADCIMQEWSKPFRMTEIWTMHTFFNVIRHYERCVHASCLSLS